MKGTATDRLTELVLLLLAAAAVWQGAALLRPPSPDDAQASPLGLSRGAKAPPPAAELDRVRILVDGNDPAAGQAAARLAELFPQSSEAWTLAARQREGAGDGAGAALAWARAVRLDPALADDKSPRFLGARIGALAEKELARLRALKGGRALAADERGELEAVYYLRRRLAGGCE
jgi:hypothetical protein